MVPPKILEFVKITNNSLFTYFSDLCEIYTCTKYLVISLSLSLSLSLSFSLYLYLYLYLSIYLSVYSDSFQTLPMQPRQSDLVTVLIKSQNVSYNTHSTFIKGMYECWNTFVSLCTVSPLYTPSHSPKAASNYFYKQRENKGIWFLSFEI